MWTSFIRPILIRTLTLSRITLLIFILVLLARRCFKGVPLFWFRNVERSSRSRGGGRSRQSWAAETSAASFPSAAPRAATSARPAPPHRTRRRKKKQGQKRRRLDDFDETGLLFYPNN